MAGVGSDLVAEFRACLAQLPRTKHGTLFEDAELQTMSDNDCRRFLTARNNKVEMAAHMARNALEWRMRIQLDKLGPSDIPTALPQGCWRFGGYTRDGRPIMLIKAAIWRSQSKL